MISYQDSVSKGTPMPCSEEKWNELIDSPKVKNICKQIALLDTSAAGYNERKQALKRRLPIIMPHAARFLHGRRVSADAVPSGLAMLDVDHVAEPRKWFEEKFESSIHSSALTGTSPVSGEEFKETLIANHIYLIAITASGQGLRVIGRREKIHSSALTGTSPVSGEELESIEQAQMRMANALGIMEYDAVTKDLARASYVVPRDYILWMDNAGLLGEPIEFKSSNVQEFKSSTLNHDPLTLNQLSSESYHGVPYAEIVKQLMATNGSMEPEVGERNTVYFGLANHMRYICDFNPDKLLRVLPDFGLSEQERRQAITSAIGRPRKDQMPVVLQSAIAVCEREQQVANGSKSPLPKAAEMTLPTLPRLLQLICRRLPEAYRPAMIIASLPVLGTLATRIRFDYLDGQQHSLSFFACITAPAASGKSFIRKPIDLLLTPINEQDALEREKEQQYKEKLRTAKNSKFQPEDPHACPRNNGVSISIAKLLQLMTYANGKHLIGIGEEMDTLLKSERAGAWSHKSDIYRLAFDNAEYGQAYMSDASFNAHIHVYYNLLLTGTPNSMTRFFKDLENGLTTRVCFAQLPDTSFMEIPVFAPYTETEKAEIIRWSRELEAIGATQAAPVSIACPQVNKAISEWLEQKRCQALDADNHAMDTFRRRAAVIGFRAGMLCYLLENRKGTKVVSDFATWVAEFVFRNQMELWGEQMEQEMTASLEAHTYRGEASSLLGMLPKEFTTNDLIQLRVKRRQSVNLTSINVVLHRWKKMNRIAKIGEGMWKRLG